MNYENLLNFNNAESTKPEFTIIPANTIVKASLVIRPGECEVDKYLTKSPHSGSIYLACEFIVLEGPFARRKIFQNIGIIGTAKEGDNDSFGKRGRSLLRAIIESFRNIMPNDESETAQNARKINHFGELNGITPIVKIGIDNDKSGKYGDRNYIISAITPDKKDYGQFIAGVLEDKYAWR